MQVPHGALRLNVMGERGANHEDATPTTSQRWPNSPGEGIEAGALGFSTSRTRNHKTSTGAYTPTLTAAPDELIGIAQGVGATGTGVLQVVSDFLDPDAEFATLREMVATSGRPMSISIARNPMVPDAFRGLLDRITEANADGLTMTGQVAPRAVGLILGLECTLNPFVTNPVYREIADRPLAEKVAALRDTGFRVRLLAEAAERSRDKLGGNLIGAVRPAVRDGRRTRLRAVAGHVARSRQRRRRGVAAPRRSRSTRCSPTTGTVCCTSRSSTTSTAASTGATRCSCTRTPCPASATAAPTSARSATAASRPRCSPTGVATATTTASRCRSSCSATAATRPAPSACSTAASIAPGLPRRPQRRRLRSAPPPQADHRPRPARQRSAPPAAGRRMAPHDRGRPGDLPRRRRHRRAPRSPRPRRPTRSGRWSMSVVREAAAPDRRRRARTGDPRELERPRSADVDDWTLRLSDRPPRRARRRARARPRRSTDDVLDVTADDFPLPTLSHRLAALADELVNGRGFARIAALDVERLGAEDASWIYWGIGMHLGEPWPQNAKGHLLGDVKDQGKAPDDPTARGNEIGGHPLDFHSDGSDLVGLFCIDAGVSGGESLVANALGAHNALVRTRPDLAAVLYEPLPYDFRGEQRDGRPAVLRDPGVHPPPRTDGRPAVRPLHPAVHPGLATPRRRPEADRRAGRGDGCLRRAWCNDADNRVEMALRPGEIQFVNNYHVLHGRRVVRRRSGARAACAGSSDSGWPPTCSAPTTARNASNASGRWDTGASAERGHERGGTRRCGRRCPSGLCVRPTAQCGAGGPSRGRPPGRQHPVGPALRSVPVPGGLGRGQVPGRRRRSPLRRSARQLHRRTARALARTGARRRPRCGRQWMDPRRRPPGRGPLRRVDRGEVPVDRAGPVHELRHRGEPDGARTGAPSHATARGARVRRRLPRRRHHLRRSS